MGIKAKAAAAVGLYLLLWLSLLILFAGIVALAAGVFMAIEIGLGPMPAAFITGGALIGLVVVLALVALVVRGLAGRSEAKRLRNAPDSVLESQLRPLLGDKATNWAKDNTGLAVVGALSAGVILAASPKLRSTLYGALAPLLTRKTLQAVQQLSDND